MKTTLSFTFGLLLATNITLFAADQPGLVRSEFIYDTAPFPSCHASTIAETKSGLVTAWFGGTRERDPGVCIYVSRMEDGKWTTPFEVANGVGFGEKRLPTWNPVLFQPKSGPLMLFYKVGPSPATWWGMVTTSTDDGKTWATPRRLPNGILGPVKNKPVQLANGDILSPTSTEGDGGWPEYKGTPYKDSDGDGMPDDWEKAHDLNPNDASDASSDLNGDGYTNIEKYLYGLNPKAKKVDWTDLKNNVDARNN